jgi:hypothetical protein
MTFGCVFLYEKQNQILVGKEITQSARRSAHLRNEGKDENKRLTRCDKETLTYLCHNKTLSFST